MPDSDTHLGEVIKPCERCGHAAWTYLDDHDCGDWEEAVYRCRNCAHVIYIELPD